jgi:hypothetical protein
MNTKEPITNEMKTKFIKSLNINANELHELNKTNQERFHLMKYMNDLEKKSRTLFHLTLTYRPSFTQCFTENGANALYKTFHKNHLLPAVLKTRNIGRPSKRELQPICFAFLEEHESDYNDISINNLSHKSKPRLHHHVIISVHPENLNFFQYHIGTNTFSHDRYNNFIMTSDLKMCDATRLSYASAMMHKYPDYLSFPDRLH